MECVKAWKDSNTLEKSSGEPSMKEYAIFSFNPEEVYDFLSWGGWNKGYESRYFIASDRFKNLEDAKDSLGYFNGLNEIQNAIEKAEVRLKANVGYELTIELLLLTLREN